MRITIGTVNGKAVYSYKSNKCMCGCDCNSPDIFTDKTTGNKYTIAVDNGELIVEPYEEEEDEEPEPAANNLVDSAIVGQAQAG